MFNTIMHCLAKFLIGSFAACCAVFVPRLTAMLATGDTNKITMLPGTFVIIGIVFAIVVGIAVMILQYGKTCPPGETFMTALGFPALLSGMLMTTTSTQQINYLAKQTSDLSNAAAQGTQIKKTNTVLIDIQPLSLNDRPSNSKDWLVNTIGIQSVLAEDFETAGNIDPAINSENKNGKWTSWATINVQEPDYVIVLDTAQNKEQAIERASELKATIPSAQAVETSQGFFVIGGTKPESSAVLEAIKIKQETGLDPELFRAQ